ncbi:hypothetical protein IFM89_001078 [Coptis chinensis]|uniref:Plant heme peroxidase family profile domain-containing protein n=1 Tax=Coptis chinensis TaxID=261450 RepID=A0A835HJQ1_9MAGN|nr:hypothetical protein IFM89_001078 [Coptis chinensis]
MNAATLSKHRWRVLNNENSIWERTFRSLYKWGVFNQDAGTEKVKRSYFWKGEVNRMQAVKDGYTWKLGDGSSIYIFTESSLDGISAWFKGDAECIKRISDGIGYYSKVGNEKTRHRRIFIAAYKHSHQLLQVLHRRSSYHSYYLLLTTASISVQGQDTRAGFYPRTCAKVEFIIRSAVQSNFESEPSIAPGLLRMHFHDCFVFQGCDASIFTFRGENCTTQSLIKGMRCQ